MSCTIWLLGYKYFVHFSIINVREGVLADLDADFTTDMLHNEVHCSAEQGGSQDTSLPYTGGCYEWRGEAAC